MKSMLIIVFNYKHNTLMEFQFNTGMGKSRFTVVHLVNNIIINK